MSQINRTPNRRNPLSVISLIPFPFRPTALALALVASASAADYAPFLEPGFPFVESTVDARGIPPVSPSDNLSPRSLVFRLGPDTYAAFDTDLLRLTAAWHGGFLQPNSIAMLSYQKAKKKMGGGHAELSSPIGTPFVATGLYPGWHVGTPSFSDPRPRGPDSRELGRGPLPESVSRYTATTVRGDSATLHYSVGGYEIAEILTSTLSQSPNISRHVRVSGKRQETLHLSAGSPPTKFHLHVSSGAASIQTDGEHTTVTIPPSPAPVAFTLSASLDQPPQVTTGPSPHPPSPHWPQTLATKGTLSGETGTHQVIDQIALPDPNPWKRNVRPSGITFAPDGSAYICTYDGDIYRVTGLDDYLSNVSWRRIASGFNEPQSLALHDGDLFVFSRGGLTRLIDLDGDSEIDRYENASDSFTQSADTRDYAHDMAVSPDGTFHLAKGGQQSDYRSRHSGRILDFTPGTTGITVHASGLRNAYIGLDSSTGKLYACDQQGHWIPSTPIHEITTGGYYGFQPARPLSDPEPEVTPPLVWIPHRACQSALDVVPVPGENRLFVLDYFRPGLLQVLLPSPGQPHAAALPLPLKPTTPILKGAINPTDGSLYLVGFQVWGTTADELAGFCRVRTTRVPSSDPVAIAAYTTGVHLRFTDPLDPFKASDPARYGISSWQYQRSANYGSGQFRSDGSDGTDSHTVHTILISKDRRSIFLASASLSPIPQIKVSFAPSDDPPQVAYISPGHLTPFLPEDHGFAPVNFPELFAAPATPRESKASSDARPTVARGEALYTSFGCVACHSVDGSTEGKAGPTWKGLLGTERKFLDGSSTVADNEYLRAAILDPADQILQGFNPTDVGMPSYRGILSDADVGAIILYIRALGSGN